LGLNSKNQSLGKVEREELFTGLWLMPNSTKIVYNQPWGLSLQHISLLSQTKNKQNKTKNCIVLIIDSTVSVSFNTTLSNCICIMFRKLNLVQSCIWTQHLQAVIVTIKNSVSHLYDIRVVKQAFKYRNLYKTIILVAYLHYKVI
jgi:hypothetical protein